jgi:Carboxypeptidase regulatory-like domain/TonB dependent receptor-like, beta-barrel
MTKVLHTILLSLSLLTLICVPLRAQQTLGSITGTVKDSSGGVVENVSVKVRNVSTNLIQSVSSRGDGSYSVVDLPIGTYEVTFSRDGFKTVIFNQILVQGNRTTTVSVVLQPGTINAQITVSSTPLLDQTDTTNGYTLGADLVQSAPLGTGSFTQLAILSPGVNADLLSGSGTNAGLGNQNIFANGQRDSSNSFNVNGVNTNNLFNGKSSSSVSANRFVLNTGENFTAGGEIQTSTSVYSAIGQALPSPPQETIEELHVNSSMYDASEGAYSGAHVSLQTKSGTNQFHGQVYEYHQTSAWNAAPFFRNSDPTIPADQKVPELKRNTFGGTIGGPILRDKLFFFASYQGQRARDLDSSLSRADVPPTLTNDRSAAALAAVANDELFQSQCNTTPGPGCITAANIDPVALKIMNAKLPNGSFLFPTPTITDPNLANDQGYDALVQGPTTQFSADQVNGNIDYNISAKDRLVGKYYFQRDPTVSPFGVSNTLGFPQTMDAGSQVTSIENTTILSSNMTWTQRFGFVRERAFANTAQQFSNSDFGINLFGNNRLPGITINNDDNTNLGNTLGIGAASNFANAGLFQNQFEGSTNLGWIVGRHSLSFGFQWDHTQLNIINKNNESAFLGFDTFADFVVGNLCTPDGGCFSANTEFLNGATNRYFRANQAGTYAQDNIRVSSNLTVNVGLRWDWDGPLVEKNGMLTNFYPQNYQYNAATDTIGNIGLVVAGNNKAFGTKGVSASTLTGRQWGFGPRIGAAWTPSFLNNFVVRAGFGIYYDRGEYFTLLSPSSGGGISGPFGVTTEQPFVVPFLASGSSTFAIPFGTTAPPPPPKNLNGVISLVPNINQLENFTTPFCIATEQSFCGPLFFGGYDPRNTLPYTENWMLDLQWQPKNDLVVRLAYVGNHGLHEVIPIPFNQARVATPSHPINGQIYSYGYSVPGVAAENVQALTAGFPTGNASLRVPFIGFDPNSQYNEAEGVSNYHALQVNVTKRAAHGLTLFGSYTWSHSLDEESGAQLFYNGNDPLKPRTGYGNSDFDRPHVFTVSYQYELPKLSSLNGFAAQAVNGWGLGGLIVAESGQPYSVIDFSGGAASLFYGGGQDQITNPIVPVGGTGSTATNPNLQGTLGVNPSNPVLNVAAFGVPLLAPGQNGVPPCDPTTGACDIYETGFGSTGRNIFRGPFQSRVDMTVFKNFKLTERFALRFDAEAFNIFNHPSFDTPNNDVRFNPFFGDPPDYVGTNHVPCFTQTTGVGLQGAYSCPPTGQLGRIQHTLGSPRFLQLALHLTF